MSIIVHEGATYVDVVEYTNAIIHDLLLAPDDMTSSRDEIIGNLKWYAIHAQDVTSEGR